MAMLGQYLGRNLARRLVSVPLRRGVSTVKESTLTSETSFEEEQALNQMKEATEVMSFINPGQTALSSEMRTKLNDEFAKFFQEFVHDVDLSEDWEEHVVSITKDTVRGSNSEAHQGYQRFPGINSTGFFSPYSKSELYARQLFHAQRVAGLGAGISGEVYRPHEDVLKPVENASIATLMAAGAHLGHSTAMARANSLPYVYGVREGIHIIDLDQTLRALKRASRVMEGIAEKGGIILFVSTRPGHEKTVEVAADRVGGYYVHSRWFPGTLTNSTHIAATRTRHEVDMSDSPTGRRLGAHLKETIVKPDICVILNPVENRALINECIVTRVPTIGIVDTDSEPSLLTYPIPGNDDSLRFSDLVAGVLSKAAERGRNTRLQEVREYEAAKQRAENGEGFNHTPTEATGKYAGLSEEEIALVEQSKHEPRVN